MPNNIFFPKVRGTAILHPSPQTTMSPQTTIPVLVVITKIFHSTENVLDFFMPNIFYFEYNCEKKNSENKLQVIMDRVKLDL